MDEVPRREYKSRDRMEEEMMQLVPPPQSWTWMMETVTDCTQEWLVVRRFVVSLPSAKLNPMNRGLASLASQQQP